MFMYKSHSNVHFYIRVIIIYTMSIQTARPSPTFIYDAVSITSWSWVYPRVISYIHRLAKWYNRMLNKKIANVACRYVNLNYFDFFLCPPSFVLFESVFYLRRNWILWYHAVPCDMPTELSLAFLKCSCEISNKRSRLQITYENSVDHTDYITTEVYEVLICFIKIVNIHI